jgi:DNA primase
MDVIALVEAGFHGAVAPLGTAITEDQLRLMWRLSPEPLIVLDGDAAGIRAALRLIDLALPLMEAGQGLRFVTLPEGMDPDDLIRARGAGAMQAALQTAEPMVNLLWRRETDGRVLDSPERRAALDKGLRALLKRIADPSIRAHYGDEIRRLRSELFGRTQLPATPFRGPGKRRGFAPPPLPGPEVRASMLAGADETVEEALREAIILAICATHPGLIAAFESPLERLHFRVPGHSGLRDALLQAAHDGLPDPCPSPVFLRKMPQDVTAVLEKILSLAHVRSAPPVWKADDAELARLCLAEELAKLDVRRAVRTETEDAMQDLAGLADEGLTWRLARAAEARHQAERSHIDDDMDMGEDRAALSAGLQRLLDEEVWVKKRH